MFLHDFPGCIEHHHHRSNARLLVIRQQDRFSYFIFLVQSYFMRLLLWEGELDRIAATDSCRAESADQLHPGNRRSSAFRAGAVVRHLGLR